jgi:hypothetical protein
VACQLSKQTQKKSPMCSHIYKRSNYTFRTMSHVTS